MKRHLQFQWMYQQRYIHVSEMVYMYHVQFVVNINVLVLIDTLELVDEFCYYSQKKPTANGKRVSVASLITIQNTSRSIAKPC